MSEEEDQVTISFRAPKRVRQTLEAYAKQQGYTTISYFLRKHVEEEFLAPEIKQTRSDLLADISLALAILLREMCPEKAELYSPLIMRLLEGGSRLRLNIQPLQSEIFAKLNELAKRVETLEVCLKGLAYKTEWLREEIEKQENEKKET